MINANTLIFIMVPLVAILSWLQEKDRQKMEKEVKSCRDIVDDLEEVICDLKIAQRLNSIERVAEHIAEAQMALVEYLNVHFEIRKENKGFQAKDNRIGNIIAIKNNKPNKK